MSLPEDQKKKIASLLELQISDQGKAMLRVMIRQQKFGKLTIEEFIEILEIATGKRSQEHEIGD